MRHLIAVLALGLCVTDALAQRTYFVRRGRFIYVVTQPDLTPSGGTPFVTVNGACRMDWKYAAPPGLLDDMPQEPRGGRPAVTYQLLVPPGYAPGRAAGLMLFLGVGNAEEAASLAAACQKAGLVLAVPVGMGDDVHPGVRLKRAVEALDDVRRKLVIDTDRLYLAGTSGGAVTASQIAHTWPEMFGGLLAIGGTTTLRAEPYLRDRVRKRLTVVLMAGQLDAGRHELERYRDPVLRDAGVKGQLLVVPARARGVPPAGVLEQALALLESGRADRAALVESLPAIRIAEQVFPSAEVWSKALLDEARLRMRAGLPAGPTLMILHGITQRWPDEDAAKKAAKLLADHDAKSPRKWEQAYNEIQVAHFAREARAADEHFKELKAIPQAVKLAEAMRQEAVRMWEQVDAFGPETRQGEKARLRLEELRKAR